MASAVILFIAETNDFNSATVVNATEQLAPNGGSFSFTQDIWNFRTYHIWAEITDLDGADRTLFLGRVSTPRIDLIPPTIGEVSIAPGANTETSLVLLILLSELVG